LNSKKSPAVSESFSEEEEEEDDDDDGFGAAAGRILDILLVRVWRRIDDVVTSPPRREGRPRGRTRGARCPGASASEAVALAAIIAMRRRGPSRAVL
jgi:hypothetical protein